MIGLDGVSAIELSDYARLDIIVRQANMSEECVITSLPIWFVTGRLCLTFTISGQHK